MWLCRRGQWLPRLVVSRRNFTTGGGNSLQRERLVEVTESPIKNVKILTMNNPTKNILSVTLMNDLLNTISEVCNPEKDVCRGIVLTSALDGDFSDGLDMSVLHTHLDHDSFTHYWSQFQKLYVTLNTLPVPLVSAINGDAVGAGCIVALASDYRVMAEGTDGRKGRSYFKIGMNATKCGFTEPPSFAALTSHVVGHRKCELLLQLGELVDAPTAKRIGLIDTTVENADEVLIPALEMAERLSSVAPWCYWMVKDMSRRKLVAPFCTPALRNAESLFFYEMLNNPDVRRDLEAYIVRERERESQGGVLNYMEGETELARSLSERLRSGRYDCAVCSESIHLADKLWACSVCHGIIHLLCVRYWVKVQAEEREKHRGTPGVASCLSNQFRCPLCQSIHPTSAVDECRCFCGKVKDPPADPLLVPGSCGQTCERRRGDSRCPHACTLMCHPGPCPPCSLTRPQSCFCGKSHKTVGCSSGVHGFECNEVCGKLLDCGNHHCTASCHEGPCPICTVVVTERCFCGATERKRRCGENAPFSCDKFCEKALDCGNHKCAFKCHKGPCQPCLRTPEKQVFCPCGKVRVRQLIDSPRKSCLDPIPSCELACEAPLPCGHTCSFVCHESPVCPPCIEVITSKCSCGSCTIQYPCFCSYLPPNEWQDATAKLSIDIKILSLSFPPRCGKLCRKQLSCGKHTCKEICCTNGDHTCYQICVKRLPCGSHSCGQLCHKGLCPPCRVASYERLYCRCRRTWIEPPVPCGTKPPNCSHECVIPRPCGHPANHPCHIEEKCPDCVIPVEKRCGSHNIVMPYHLPCYRQAISCGKKCNKPLRCCGKLCDKTCHAGPCEHQCTNRFPTL